MHSKCFSSHSSRPKHTNSKPSFEIPDRCFWTLCSGFTFSGLLMKPFVLVCLPSIATGERALLIKASHLHWALIFAWMRWFTGARSRDIGDWGCTVRVPDSHRPSPHFRSTGKRLMLRYLRRRGRQKKKRAGGIKAFSHAFLWIYNSYTVCLENYIWYTRTESDRIRTKEGKHRGTLSHNHLMNASAFACCAFTLKLLLDILHCVQNTEMKV